MVRYLQKRCKYIKSIFFDKNSFTKEQSDIYNEEKNDRKDFLDKYEKMKEKCKESSVYRHYYAIEQSKEINRIVIDEYLNKLCSKPNFPYK